MSCSGRMLTMIAALMVTGAVSGAENAPDAPTVRQESERPRLWMLPPPWEGNGDCLRELLNHEEQWAETRSKLDGMGYWPLLLSVHFSDDEIRTLFSKLAQWKLEFGFEVPVFKGDKWCGEMPPLKAQSAFDLFQQLTARFKPLGMGTLSSISFDEPIYAALHFVPHQVAQGILSEADGFPGPDLSLEERMDVGIRETATFIELVREAYPEARLGDVEPFPACRYENLVYALENLQSECSRRGVKGLDFLRLDVDWSLMSTSGNPVGSWAEVKRVEDYCRSKSIAFGMIYWAADFPYLKARSLDHDMAWYAGVMHHGAAYALVGGKPDEYIVESWVHAPAHAVPETDRTTFTRSVLDFAKAFMPLP